MKRILILVAIVAGSCSSNNRENENSTADIPGPKYIFASNLNCEQTRLSEQFNIDVNFKRYTDTSNQRDSCTIKLLVKDKVSSQVFDSISLISRHYLSDLFVVCDSVTSFTTGFNSDRIGMDNYYGDIIVADLNFDGKDDIVLINANTSNSGAFYSYFVQQDHSKFEIDAYLTDSVSYFPAEIDRSKKRLITYVRAGSCCMGEHIYQLNGSNKWKQISHKILRATSSP